MDIKVDFNSTIPLYEQIAHQVLELIDMEEIKPGDQLPTIRELAVELGINFNTVARAYRMLDQGSVISTQQGRGTYILEQRKTKKVKTNRPESIEELTRYYLRKANYLGFKPEEIKKYFEKIYQEGKDK